MELTRRRFISVAAMTPAATLIPGCQSLLPSVECDQPASTGIDWILPDIARPIAHTRIDPTPVFAPSAARVGEGIFPPRSMLIYYPAIAPGGRMLRPCLGRYPVVLFMHGDPGTIPASYYHARWHRLPATLARCGYVVVVPSHRADVDPTDASVAAALADLAWVRDNWSEHLWLDQRPEGVLFMGHSRGALLAARLAAAHPCSAFASLGGVFHSTPGYFARLRQISVPSFFMFLGGNSIGASNENIEGSVFESLSQPKWKAVYDGSHFDYLDPADSEPEERGACSLIPQLAADLVTLFAGATVASNTAVAPSLRRPQVSLTSRQQAFAQGHLTAESQLKGQRDCKVTLSWSTSNDSGNRTLGAS